MQTKTARKPKEPLSENAYMALKRGILDGALSPGSPLSEFSLAQQFQTSRSPVREALGRLEQEGYVSRKANGRIIVTALDTAELEQLYEVRGVLEGLAARLATPRLNGLLLDELAARVQQMEERACSDDVSGSLTEGERFHDIILDNCGNIPLRKMLRGLRSQIKRYRSVIAGARSQRARSNEHKKILRSLEKRNADAAEQAMKDHIRQSAQALLSQMRK
jgi:DNA-binding GntR family transcriptional regulator